MLWRAVVRTDPAKGDELKQSEVFEASNREAAKDLRSDAWGKNSLSGRERNRLFLSQQGKQFTDVSLVSGADHIGDGRSTVMFDYDRDGWVDIAGVNVNAPRLVLFRNRIGELPGIADSRHMVALRFRGASRIDSISPGRSNRDGYGAKVTLTLPDGSTIVDEHRCGEGFSAQNSSTMLIGVGSHERIKQLKVRWPSGVEQTFTDLPVDSLISIEELETTPNIAPYRIPNPARTIASGKTREFFTLVTDPATTAKLRLHVLTATWCVACKKELPHLARLRKHFTTAQLAMTGLPGDAEETAAQLLADAKKHRPAYQLVPQIDESDRTAVNALLQQHLGSIAATLPSFVLTDADGTVLQVGIGSPTLSEITRHLTKE
ncbi:MAG: ASPIC/UnbV domain-containing protein [Verrucomicrobiales bacterium]